MNEWTYIATAYGASFALLAALILATLTRARRIKKQTIAHET